MKGRIYLIENTCNDKVYIGKTLNTLHCRFKEHIRESRKEESSNRKIYRAMNKYGIENFSIRLLEDNVEDKELSEKEISYIKEFNSYECGYNTTLGGDGSRYINIPDSEIIDHYLTSKSMRHTAKHFSISEDTIALVLHNNEVKIFKPNAKRIKIVELNLEFDSISDCEKYLRDNNFTKATTIGSIAVNIKRSIKRNGSYLGFTYNILD